jgi:hypothetical protein
VTGLTFSAALVLAAGVLSVPVLAAVGLVRLWWLLRVVPLVGVLLVLVVPSVSIVLILLVLLLFLA